MNKRRCFSKSILQSDSFLDLDPLSQMVYIHMNLEADDEGFVNNPKRIARMIDADSDNIDELINHNFIILFDSGVIAIKHWFIHNTKRSDRFKPTVYQEEKAQLTTKENGVYTLWQPNGNQMATNGIPNGNQMATNGMPNLTKLNLNKHNLSKSVKDKINNKNKEETDQTSPTNRFGTYSNVLLSMEEYDLFSKECPIADERIEKLSKYIQKTGKYKDYISHYEPLSFFWKSDKGEQPSYDITEFEVYKKPVYKAN
ncbi:MAG: replisome organizer [Prevotellaceae bacterium]|nr:replisome organizer [Candidatus Faecinaster equi]